MSAFVLGLAQGMVTGMRGLCNGLGPAVFGLIFYLFHVDLNMDEAQLNAADKGISPTVNTTAQFQHHQLVEHVRITIKALLLLIKSWFNMKYFEFLSDDARATICIWLTNGNASN